MTPVLCFEYRPVERTDDLDELLQTCEEGIDVLRDRYVLLMNKDQFVCHIHEILISDISNVYNRSIRETYDKIYERYPTETIGAIIVDEPDNIKRKIRDVIYLAMCKLNTNKIRLQWNKYYSNPTEVSSIPSILYELVQTDYQLLGQRINKKSVSVTIKDVKREFAEKQDLSSKDDESNDLNPDKENEEYD